MNDSIVIDIKNPNLNAFVRLGDHSKVISQG